MAIKNKKRTILKDVAMMAGTSIATASRAINKRGYIGEETRKRVEEAARKLNYQPNLQARALRQQSTNAIGLIIPNLLNAYYTALADSISLLLSEEGYYLMLSSTRDDPHVEEEILYGMVGRAVDGIIWVPTIASGNILSYVIEEQIPTVSIIRRVQSDSLDTILFEDIRGSEAATQHLIDLGHKRIAYVGGDTRQSSNHDRWQGFIKTMQDANLPIDNSLIKIGSTWSIWGEVAMNDLLSLASPPTAIFVGSSAIMPGLLKILRQRQFRLPEEMSLICFDDLDWFSYSVPSITAVTTNHKKLAEAAVNLLLRRIETPRDALEPPISIRINFELILRQSTVPLRPIHTNNR